MCTLYERIINLCEKKGIKGGKMCVDLGMSKATLTELKMGRQTGLSTAKAQKIASYLGVSVDYLINGEENPETKKAPSVELTEGEKMLLELFRKVPENQQQMVLQMISAALKTIE